MESSQHKIAVSSLMSPPDPAPYESFHKPTSATPLGQNKLTFTAPSQGFLSPPVSPESQTSNLNIVDRMSGPIYDPILYPHRDSSPNTQPPLFAVTSSLPHAHQPSADEINAQHLIEQHISERARRKQLFRESSPPKPDEYALALEFKSQVMRRYDADRPAWMTRERQFLIDGQRARNMAKKNVLPAQPMKKIYPALAPSPTGVQKVRAPTKPIVRTPKQRRERNSATPDMGGTTGRSRNTGTSTREDKDFGALVDRCPPLSSLPNRPNSLKVEWKGAPLDLTSDPHRHLLHPDEVLLASNLRLDCATYLTSKRRIFLARLECALGTWGGGKGKKEFRKTDAQQACKIDVNKASKLWMAFEKVGWLEERWCRQWM